jgi:anaerobic selenocysteine-containing dehydrogenase
VGSPKAFSSVTIDQSSKAVAAGRIGIWPPGRTPFHRGDVFLIVGGNPLLSLTTTGFDFRNPLKRLKEAKRRGMKLIVIDPRRTETAKFADVFLQPLPGEDCAILACLINIILARGWQDREFSDNHAAQLDALQRAVAGFTPEFVASRAGVTAEELVTVAEVFAHQCSTGAATSATGPDMAPHANLAEHLVECINVICGRFLRAGDRIDNPGVINPPWPRPAEVMPAPRWWEHGYRSRVGDYGLLDGELPSATLADEILQPGPGQVKCLLVHGGNPASAIPDQRKVVQALEQLDLLVTIEPFMTVTARLSDYILPPTMQYERADLPLFVYESMIAPEPYTRYTPPVAARPADSELVDDALVFWQLARRLNLQLDHFGEALDMGQPPTVDQLLASAARHAPFAFDELQRADRGILVDGLEQFAEAGDPDSPHRFTLLPDDVAAELADVAATAGVDQPYRLAVRRLRDTLNSACRNLPSIRNRMPYNLAYLNRDDMTAENLADGDEVMLESDHGAIPAVVAADPELRPGVVSISHGFGGLPDEDDYRQLGSSVNLLISTDRDCETINAMPRMSGIPVAIYKKQAVGEQQHR